jgi:hypothetical protein
MILRGKHGKNFMMISNVPIDDGGLSAQSLGVLVYLYSRPDDWRLLPKDSMRRFNLGHNKVYSVINELIRAGYIAKVPVKAAHGRFVRYEYIINDVPGNAAAFAREITGQKSSNDKVSLFKVSLKQGRLLNTYRKTQRRGEDSEERRSPSESERSPSQKGVYRREDSKSAPLEFSANGAGAKSAPVASALPKPASPPSRLNGHPLAPTGTKPGSQPASPKPMALDRKPETAPAPKPNGRDPETEAMMRCCYTSVPAWGPDDVEYALRLFFKEEPFPDAPDDARKRLNGRSGLH